MSWLPLAAILLTSAAAFACAPARIDVSLDPHQPAVAGATLRIQVRVKDESGRPCALDDDLVVHLEASDSHQQKLKVSAADIGVPRGASEGAVSSVVAQSPGLLTVRATADRLRPGVASAYIRGNVIPKHAGTQNPPWLVTAAFQKAGTQTPHAPVKVFAHCAEGGEVSANGQDSVIVHADLAEGPYTFPVRLKFATGALDWDGQIDIPAGAVGKSKEIHSTRIGAVRLDTLLDADPRNVALDPEGALSCKDVRFISPVQFADLELQSPSVSYGENVQISVYFRDRDYNKIPIDNADRARIQVVAGKQPFFSRPELLNDGSAVLICKPNWWGAHRFQLMDGTLRTVFHDGGAWKEGPIQLSVLFPWIPLLVCTMGGFAGALIKWKEEVHTLKLHERLFIGVVAALVLMIAAVALPLTASVPLPYPVLLVIPSIIGGFMGSQVFKWVAEKYGLQPDTVPAGASKLVGGL